MQKLSSRTDTFTDSLIRRMTRVSLEYNAINLSQGFPDFDPPKAITDRLAEISDAGPHQYAVTWGAQNFREALAKKQSRYMGLPINPNTQVLVTCGSTEAMMCAMMTVCNPGDKVIIFSPFYENYGADTILTGAVPIYVQLEGPEFRFDPEKLEDAFRQHPKAIVVCNPSNPTGRVFTKEELTVIADLAKKYDTYVITDEVYEHIVYEPYRHTYIASLPGMFERTISCSSLSKTYSITGWRLGYIKRTLFLNGLDRLGIRHNVPQGAYYMMLDISDYKGYDTDVDFCVKLAEKVGVGAVPGSAFYDIPEHRYIRMHFAKSSDTLNEALNRLEQMKTRM